MRKRMLGGASPLVIACGEMVRRLASGRASGRGSAEPYAAPPL